MSCLSPDTRTLGERRQSTTSARAAAPAAWFAARCRRCGSLQYHLLADTTPAPVFRLRMGRTMFPAKLPSNHRREHYSYGKIGILTCWSCWTVGRLYLSQTLGGCKLSGTAYFLNGKLVLCKYSNLI